MSEIAYQKARYFTSAVTLAQLPVDEGIEIAFIGRSNAGKSSAINAITGIKNLARISKQPGRTQMINLFSLDEQRRIVDLPGYGYANVPKNILLRWSTTIEHYLQQRRCLCGLIIVMDIRHPLKELDQRLIQWSIEAEIPVHLLLTKADKLSKMQAHRQLSEVNKQLNQQFSQAVSAQLFSATKKIGVDAAHIILDEWFVVGPAPDPA